MKGTEKQALLGLRDEERQKKIAVFALLVFFAAYSSLFSFYTSIARATVPIMDFWRYIYKFGEATIKGEASLSLFLSDGGEHSQALSLYVIFSILKRHKFDVQPLVYYGCAVIACQGIVLLAYYFKRNKETQLSWLTVISALMIVLIVFNYNAWEMVTEPFSFSAEVRTLFFYILFILTDMLYRRSEKYSGREMILYSATLGSLYVFIGAFISGGHSVALLSSYLLASVVCYFDNKKLLGSRAVIPLVFSGVSIPVTVLIYFMNVSFGGQKVTIAITEAGEYIRGFLIGLGSSVIHQGKDERMYFVVGVIIILWTVGVIICFLGHAEWRREQLFPFLCLLFGGISVIVICIGRVGAFNAQYIASSRYTVEKNFGLLGLIWLTSSLGEEVALSNKTKKAVYCLISIVLIGTMAYFLIASALEEWRTAPYRGAYYTNLATIMRNIDSYTDEQLSGFQSSPVYVRGAVKFLAMNHLSIFR